MIAGTRAVQQSILGAYPNEDIQILIVWIRMAECDSLEAAQRAAELYLNDPRPIQFYDPRKRIGSIIAEGFGAESGQVAWDVYLFYDGEGKWADRAPMPVDWAHQLVGSSWADPARLHRGDDLTKELHDIMGNLVKRNRLT